MVVTQPNCVLGLVISPRANGRTANYSLFRDLASNPIAAVCGEVVRIRHGRTMAQYGTRAVGDILTNAPRSTYPSAFAAKRLFHGGMTTRGNVCPQDESVALDVAPSRLPPPRNPGRTGRARAARKPRPTKPASHLDTTQPLQCHNFFHGEMQRWNAQYAGPACPA